MKTSLSCEAVVAMVVLAAAPLIAQTQTTTSTTSTTYLQTSKIVGTKVKTSLGEEIGEIKDVVLDRNTGCMAYTVLSAGGTSTRITGTAKLVAVPWALYSITSDPRVYAVRIEKEKIYSAPVFEYSRIDEYPRSGWINNVYSYYGMSANVGLGAQTTVTGGGTTAPGSPAASASPMATASPTATAAATATASPVPTASSRAAASAPASPAASPSATGSPKATRGECPSGKAKATVTPSSRRHTEATSPGETTESPSEATTSPSSERKKTSRRHATEGTTQPSATPETPQQQE